MQLLLYEVRVARVVVQVVICLCLVVSLSMANSHKRSQNKKYYTTNRDTILSRIKVAYKANPEVNKEAAKGSYNADTEPKRSARIRSQASYSANPDLKKQASRDSYNANPDPKKASFLG